MNIKQIVTASADVINITRLRKGDVLKVIPINSYSSLQVHFAVVTDILNDGQRAFVEVLEYTKNYAGVELSYRVLTSDKDDQVSVFPAEPSEVASYFAEIETKMAEEIEKLQRQLDEKRTVFGHAQAVFQRGLHKLSTPIFEVSPDLIESGAKRHAA
jgi:predicted NACHT family NTPase